MGASGKRNAVPYTEQLRQMNEDLQNGSFSDVYILSGGQAYLRNQNRDTLLNKLLPGAAGDMNFAKFTGKDFEARQVTELADTMPFFSERRVLFFENTGLWGKDMKDTADALASYIPEMPATTVLIFSENSVDRTRSLYKALTDSGSGKRTTVLTCDDIDEATLKKWIVHYFRENGKTISPAAVELFLSTTGNDMLRIRSEQDKLISYLGFGEEDRKEVTAEDIRDMCEPVLNDRIFEMIDCIAGGRITQALTLYSDLQKLQTPPQVILTLLERNFRRMIILKEAQDSGKPMEEVLSGLNIRDWVYRKNYVPLLRTQSAGALRRSLDGCLKAERDYKEGRISDVLAVEMLLAAGSPERSRRK